MARPSSNSSATDGGVTALVARSLDVLAAEQPAARLAMAERMGRRRIAITVGGESLWLSAEGVEHGAGGAVAATVRTDRAALLDLADGRTTIVDALLADRLHVHGAPDDVLALEATLACFLHGLMRAPSAPALLETLRRMDPT